MRELILKHKVSLIIIAVWTALVYLNAFQIPFIWDDIEMVQQNQFIRSLDNLRHVFTTSAFGGAFDTGKFYRPIQILSYILDYSLWGLTPFGYHLTSILIHIFSCGLLYFLALKFQLSPRLACMVSILYAIHPLHIEAVSYISGRGDVFNLFFALSTFLLFLEGIEQKIKWLYLSLITFVLGVLSKENIIILPLIMTAYYLLLFEGRKEKVHKIYLVILNGLSVAYSFWRINPFVVKTEGVLSEISQASFLERVFTFLKSIVLYLKLCVFPYPLHMEYHFVEKTLFSSSIILGIPVAILLFWGMVRCINVRRGVFYLSWFFIGLIPVSNLLHPLASTIREHWLYIPSVGLFLLVFESLNALSRKYEGWVGDVLSICFLVALIVFSFVTFFRNEQWKDPFVFYTHDLQCEPKSFVMENNLGTLYLLEKNNIPLAKYHFKRSIDVSPNKNYSVGLNNYGYILELEGNLNQAAYYYLRSIRATHYYLGYSNLSRLLNQQSQYSVAYALANEGLSYYPKKIPLILAQIDALIGLKEYSQAQVLFRWVKQVSPSHYRIPDLEKMLYQ